MKPLFTLGSVTAVIMLLIWVGAKSAPGVELTHAAAAAIAGGADCGDTYEYKSIACPDDAYRHNGQEVNCKSASYETYSSTGTGTRKPGYTTTRSCRVCGSFCNSSTSVQSHVPKKCNSSP